MVRKPIVGLSAALLLLAVTLVPTSANAWHRRHWSPGFSISFGLGLDIRLGLSRLLSTVLGWLEALRISSRLLAAAVPWLGLSILQVPLGVSFFALFSLSRHLRSSRGLSGLGRKPMQDRSRSPPAPLASRPPLLVAGITRRSRAAPLSGAIREPDITRMFDGASILQA
jgi:hypothetical protein